MEWHIRNKSIINNTELVQKHQYFHNKQDAIIVSMHVPMIMDLNANKIHKREQSTVTQT